MNHPHHPRRLGLLVGALLVLGAAGLRQLWRDEPRHEPRSLRPAEPKPVPAAPAPVPAEVPAPPTGAVREAATSAAARSYEIQLRRLQQDCFRSSPADRAYRGEPISKFSIRIPTSPARPTPFDFCVDEVRFDGVIAPWGRGAVFDVERNRFGVSGPWFHFGDDVTIWERPGPDLLMGETVRSAGAPICIKGTAAQLFQNRVDDYWGAALGFHFLWSAHETLLFEPKFETVQLSLRGPQIPPRLGFYVDDDRGGGARPRVWCELLTR